MRAASKPTKTASKRANKPDRSAAKPPVVQRERPLLPPEELRAAIERLEQILAPLIARLGIEDAWAAATPKNLTDLGPVNYFGVKTRPRQLFGGLAHANAHLFGAFLDGSLRRSIVLYDLDDDELRHARSEPSDAPVLVVDPRDYPPEARTMMGNGILGHHDGAVIAVERTLEGTMVYAIRRKEMTRLGTFLELAEEGVAALLPLQA